MNKTSICIPVKEKVIDTLGIRSVPLSCNGDKQGMIDEFSQAPQFSKINLADSYRPVDGRVRVILVGNQDYSMEQCAMYLASLAGVPTEETEEDEDWLDVDDDEEEQDHDNSTSMVIVPSKLIGSAVALPSPEPKPQVRLNALPFPALYVKVEHGDTLSSNMVNEIIYSRPEEKRPHLFIALEANQMDSALSAEIQLTHGFVVCHVEAPTEEYLKEVFWKTAERYYPNLRENEEISPDQIMNHLKQLRGKKFCQRDLESCLTQTIHLQKDAKTLSTEDFLFQPTPLSITKSGRVQLESMVELEQVKDVVSRLLAMDQLNIMRRDAGMPVESRHRHIAFTGAPGTGKTVCAQLLAKIMEEEGEGSGLFVEAGREDMIGSYVGHTAPKIAELFKKAYGGVLFLDEIGALVPGGRNGSDTFAEEAINALVYHMDRNPETIVIFATYPDEMESFLESNPGLKSRLAQTVHFPSYGKKALEKILLSLCEKQGYGISKKAIEVCENYLIDLEKKAPKTFGNGREVRRVFNAAEEEMALRLSKTPSSNFNLSQKDFSAAVERLQPKSNKIIRPIGFAV